MVPVFGDGAIVGRGAALPDVAVVRNHRSKSPPLANRPGQREPRAFAVHDEVVYDRLRRMSVRTTISEKATNDTLQITNDVL